MVHVMDYGQEDIRELRRTAEMLEAFKLNISPAHISTDVMAAVDREIGIIRGEIEAWEYLPF